MLRVVDRYLVKDVSGQPIGPVFKGASSPISLLGLSEGERLAADRLSNFKTVRKGDIEARLRDQFCSEKAVSTRVVPKVMSNFFFACELGTADEGEFGGRWNLLLCYP